jgi:hypothetical protein
VYSRFFDTHVVDRSTNGVDGLLAAPEDKQPRKFVSTRPQKLKPLKPLSSRRPARATEATPIDLPQGRT